MYELVAWRSERGWRWLAAVGARAGTPIVLVGAVMTGLAVSPASKVLELSWAFLLSDGGRVLVAAACVAALARTLAAAASGVWRALASRLGLPHFCGFAPHPDWVGVASIVTGDTRTP